MGPTPRPTTAGFDSSTFTTSERASGYLLQVVILSVMILLRTTYNEYLWKRELWEKTMDVDGNSSLIVERVMLMYSICKSSVN